MIVLRHAGRLFGDLVLFGVRSGRWWISALIVILIVVSVLVVTAKAVVPVATYTLF